jgi:outer membrane receptor protein involved in Fe transport
MQTAGIVDSFDADHYDVRNAFNYYNFFGFTGQLSSIFHSSSETYSAYATATWHVTDEFSLIAGVRGTDVSRRGNYDLALTSGMLFPGTAPVAIPTDHENESFFSIRPSRPNIS